MESVEIANAVDEAFSDVLPQFAVDALDERLALASPFKACIDIRLSRALDPSAPELALVRSRVAGHAALTLVRDEVVRLRFKVSSASEENRARVASFGAQVTEFLDEPVEHLLSATVAYTEVKLGEVRREPEGPRG